MRRVLVGFAVSLTATGPALAQEMPVLATIPQGTVVDVSGASTVAAGTRFGFVEIQAGRREIAQGAVAEVREGRALVQLTAGGGVKVGDVAVLCPDPSADRYHDLRSLLQQFRMQTSQAGSAALQIEPTVAQLETALATRDDLIRNGACDTVEYDRQIAALSADLRNLSTLVGTSTPSTASWSSNAPSPTAPAAPWSSTSPAPMAPTAPWSSSTPPSTQWPSSSMPPASSGVAGSQGGTLDSAVDALTKLVSLLQNIGAKFGQRNELAPASPFSSAPYPADGVSSASGYPPPSGMYPPVAVPPSSGVYQPPPSSDIGGAAPPSTTVAPPSTTPPVTAPPSTGASPTTPPNAGPPPPGGPPTQPTAGALSTIHGRVLANATGVGGALVSAVEWNQSVKTAPDGAFFVRGPGGRVTLSVKAPGFEPGTLVTMAAHGVAVTRNVLLKRSAGAGPPGDEVVRGPRLPPVAQPTGPGGATPWWTVPTIKRPLASTAPSASSADTPSGRSAVSGDPTVSGARPPARVDGQVTDDLGRPVRGARVSFTGGAPASTVMSGDAGRFTMEAIQPGEYRVMAVTPGLLPATRNIRIDPGQVAMVALSLTRPARIQGRVTDNTGRPIPGAHVTLNQRPIAISRDDGSFTTADLHPGNYHLTANASGFRDGMRSVNLTPGEVETVTLLLVRTPAALPGPTPMRPAQPRLSPPNSPPR